jgi:hypothetical protein
MSSEIHLMPGGSTNDVAVVKFPRPLGRRAVPLLLSRDAIPGEPAVMAGFGEGTGAGKGVLRAAFVTIESLTSTSAVVQASSSGSRACSGDSGGPLLVKLGGEYVIVGIATGGSDLRCAGSGTTYYTLIKREEISGFILQYVPDAIKR